MSVEASTRWLWNSSVYVMDSPSRLSLPKGSAQVLLTFVLPASTTGLGEEAVLSEVSQNVWRNEWRKEKGSMVKVVWSQNYSTPRSLPQTSRDSGRNALHPAMPATEMHSALSGCHAGAQRTPDTLWGWFSPCFLKCVLRLDHRKAW